jgi:hypothetical protein
MSWSNGHGQTVKINGYFDNFNNIKIWSYRDCHDRIRIDYFDHTNFVILGMVLVKFVLTILTMEPQFGKMVKKSWSLDTSEFFFFD